MDRLYRVFESLHHTRWFYSVIGYRLKTAMCKLFCEESGSRCSGRTWLSMTMCYKQVLNLELLNWFPVCLPAYSLIRLHILSMRLW